MSEVQREPSFEIDTDAKAEWALQKIREARADRDRWVEWYNHKIAEVKEATDINTANLEFMLERYFNTVPHKKTKTQESYSLPGGKMVLKRQNPEYKRDEKVAIAWLKENGCDQYIKVSESLDWATLKGDTIVSGGKIFTTDGEEIPGIEVIDRPEKFTVEV